MSLTALLEAAPAGRQDRVAAVYQELTGEQREAFRVLIRDARYTAPQIAEALTAMGYQVTAKQVVHYRAKLREGVIDLESD